MAIKTPVITFHLAQDHVIPESDQRCGKEFIDCTSAAKVRLLFPGHYQPYVAADSGVSGLPLPEEARHAPAALAWECGNIDCYCQYWCHRMRIGLLSTPYMSSHPIAL